MPSRPVPPCTVKRQHKWRTSVFTALMKPGWAKEVCVHCNLSRVVTPGGSHLDYDLGRQRAARQN